MKIDDSIFAVKLYEMAEQYGKMQCRIRVCEQGNEAKIHSELKKAEEELEESTLLLEEKAGSCRSEAVKILSQIQLDYRKKTQELMKNSLRTISIPKTAARRKTRAKPNCCMRNMRWISPRLQYSRH